MQSRKAKEFERNVRVALCFHWKSLKKQIRIEGPLLELPKNEADIYFQSRARDSQIGAWASQQSSYLPKGYKSLEEKIEFYESKFKNQVVPRPSFWGGRIVVPERIEFWKDVKNRLHERMLFKADNEYDFIETIVAHEYFHNWTGNRITCRDWFQLSLKEGLTVYRDQEFSSDMGSRAVKRIKDVRLLRTVQFAEDASPLAHSVRPKSYAEINNFYTATVYNLSLIHI